ncbi:MAG: hypothetical protein KIC90_00835 [Firmicutes bacterium]|nr:hypothetical protein [Bacillota bacterium]
MKILCNKYETKEIIKFMRDCCEKTQTEFASDLNKKRGWTAKLEGDETNITLKDFLELAKINNIDIIMKSNDTEKN